MVTTFKRYKERHTNESIFFIWKPWHNHRSSLFLSLANEKPVLVSTKVNEKYKFYGEVSGVIFIKGELWIKSYINKIMR